MPELPEVETVCRGLARKIVGRRFERVDQHRDSLRIPLPERFAERLEGRRIDAVWRRAKYILIDLDDGEVLVVHLGMSGRITMHTDAGSAARPPGRHDHIVFHTDDGLRITFNDARRFGLMTLIPAGELGDHRLFAGLGPEPLGNAFDGPALARLLAGKRTPVKAAILDQRVVVGIGNIYASEALFRARISPRRSAHTVQGGRADRLATQLRAVLEEAIEAGGSSLRDYVQTSGELGYFQHSFRVYGREGEPCPDCAAPIRRFVQSGRSTFHCPGCQR
jgi:formamidopyrimidine-DNA glycosylase